MATHDDGQTVRVVRVLVYEGVKDAVRRLLQQRHVKGTSPTDQLGYAISEGWVTTEVAGRAIHAWLGEADDARDLGPAETVAATIPPSDRDYAREIAPVSSAPVSSALGQALDELRAQAQGCVSRVVKVRRGRVDDLSCGHVLVSTDPERRVGDDVACTRCLENPGARKLPPVRFDPPDVHDRVTGTFATVRTVDGDRIGSVIRTAEGRHHMVVEGATRPIPAGGRRLIRETLRQMDDTYAAQVAQQETVAAECAEARQARDADVAGDGDGEEPDGEGGADA